tara:strand:+ start:1227 stop:2057 length:831 start_codon:yes stop_codon:yes gene_type:complete
MADNYDKYKKYQGLFGNSFTGGLLGNPNFLIGANLIGQGIKGQDPFSSLMPSLINAAKVKKAFAPSGFRQLSIKEKRDKKLPEDKQFQIDLSSGKVSQIGGSAVDIDLNTNEVKPALNISSKYEAESKNFKLQNATKNAILANTQVPHKDRTPEDDFSLIYKVYKFYDPTSVIRESEFENLQNTGSYQRKFGKIIPRLTKGTTLSQDQVENLEKTVTREFPTYLKEQKERYKRYNKMMELGGFDASIFLQDYTTDAPLDLSQMSNEELLRLLTQQQ